MWIIINGHIFVWVDTFFIKEKSSLKWGITNCLNLQYTQEKSINNRMIKLRYDMCISAEDCKQL
jgi:hypothetical protein